MIKNQRASSYAELNAFIQNHKASIGRYLVEHDETNLSNPIEYYYNGTALVVVSGSTKGGSSGGGLPTILGEVTDETLIETTYPTPAINDGVIVKKDSTKSNRRTWYVYDGDDWIYKGTYKGDNTQEEVSLADTRASIIVADTDYVLPNEMEYTVDSDQLSIMMNNQVAIRGIDWVEVGSTGIQSKTIQFKYNIPISTNIVFRKDVASTDLLFMQRNIDMDLIRKQTCAMMGVEYGGEIQYTTLREPEKVYWCNVNKKWYVPKFANLLPVMTSNSQDGWILSSSSNATGNEFWKIFDADTSNFWQCSTRDTAISEASPEFFVIEKATKFHMNAFKWIGPMDAYNKGHVAFVPKRVKIEGYDGGTWKLLDYYSDILFDQTLLNGDTIPINNKDSYYKYKFTIESTKYPAAGFGVGLGGMECYSGKGSWTVADSMWSEFDPDAVQPFVINMTTSLDKFPPLDICGTKSRKLCHMELDWYTSLTTEYDNVKMLNIPLAPKMKEGCVDVELNGGNGGFIKIYTNGTLWVSPSVDTPTKRSWFQITYPIKKEVRTYV